jgi:hypothetical protein
MLLFNHATRLNSNMMTDAQMYIVMVIALIIVALAIGVIS